MDDAQKLIEAQAVCFQLIRERETITARLNQAMQEAQAIEERIAATATTPPPPIALVRPTQKR